jgi:MFS family permease
MANVILFATLIWSATTHSFHSLEAARIIAAFALCCGEVLPAIVVKDIFFLHERGWWMGVYMYLFQAGPCALIIGSSFLITAKGWRWQFWVFFGFADANW